MSVKYTHCFFRAEVANLGCKRIWVGLREGITVFVTDRIIKTFINAAKPKYTS
jgi:hypothetical protein